jgi:hypothetical protein
MSRFAFSFFVLMTIALGPNFSSAEDSPQPIAREKPIRPQVPGGLLSDLIGTYQTIEGLRYEGNSKVESNTLTVDTLNGKKLDKPIQILIHNVQLPAKQRCVLKGYELGQMIGRPPAEYDAAPERGQDPDELARRDQTVWRWRPYFVVLIAAKPEGLEVKQP